MDVDITPFSGKPVYVLIQNYWTVGGEREDQNKPGYIGPGGQLVWELEEAASAKNPEELGLLIASHASFCKGGTYYEPYVHLTIDELIELKRQQDKNSKKDK